MGAMVVQVIMLDQVCSSPHHGALPTSLVHILLMGGSNQGKEKREELAVAVAPGLRQCCVQILPRLLHCSHGCSRAKAYNRECCRASQEQHLQTSSHECCHATLPQRPR